MCIILDSSPALTIIPYGNFDLGKASGNVQGCKLTVIDECK